MDGFFDEIVNRIYNHLSDKAHPFPGGLLRIGL
jgi:hypothetical protein